MPTRNDKPIMDGAGHGWVPVVFSSDCDDEGDCPNCGIDYAECPCPGPTLDDYEYEERNGVLYARPLRKVT